MEKLEGTWTPPLPELQGTIIGPGRERSTATWTWTPKPLRGRPVSWKLRDRWLLLSSILSWSSSSSFTSGPLSLTIPRNPAILLKNRIPTQSNQIANLRIYRFFGEDKMSRCRSFIIIIIIGCLVLAFA